MHSELVITLFNQMHGKQDKTAAQPRIHATHHPAHNNIKTILQFTFMYHTTLDFSKDFKTFLTILY